MGPRSRLRIGPSATPSPNSRGAKGAFAEAVDQRAGRFELANGGTTFLEPIGELPLDTGPRVRYAHRSRPIPAHSGARSACVTVGWPNAPTDIG
ncbi:MAG: hypothetical protein FJW27_15485 [Acidimicrobiia bacterium]|nr:hypothetical protein [Acidimicrobiia bacterium]